MKSSPNWKKQWIYARYMGIYLAIFGGVPLGIAVMVLLLGEDKNQMAVVAIVLGLFNILWGLSILFIVDYFARRGYAISIKLAMTEIQAAWQSPVFPPRFSMMSRNDPVEMRGLIATKDEFKAIIREGTLEAKKEQSS